MKKGLIVLMILAVLCMLTACAATQPYDGGYSNVSTTRNGYVNGMNGYAYGGTSGMYGTTPGYNGQNAYNYNQGGTSVAPMR